MNFLTFKSSFSATYGRKSYWLRYVRVVAVDPVIELVGEWERAAAMIDTNPIKGR